LDNWNSLKVIDVSSTGAFGTDNAATFMTRNAYYNGTNWIYKTSSDANHFASTGSTFAWYNAPSGTAGNAITFTQAMTLDASGRAWYRKDLTT
jgi:nitrous oxide reductase accessory protein NosL